jgi:hypothetical protein
VNVCQVEYEGDFGFYRTDHVLTGDESCSVEHLASSSLPDELYSDKIPMAGYR